MQKLEILADIQSPHSSDRGDTIRLLRGDDLLLEIEVADRRRRRTVDFPRSKIAALTDAMLSSHDTGGTRDIWIGEGRIQVRSTNRGDPFMEGIEIAFVLPTDDYADDSVFLTKREMGDLIRALKAA